MSITLRAYIVEDEPLSRAELKFMLSDSHPEVDVVGETDSAAIALAAIARLAPDLVFLDINFDVGNEGDNAGLQLARDIARLAQPPFVVFVTGRAEFALEAHSLHPAHYLVKPFGPDHLAEAVNWVAQRREFFQSEAQRLSQQRDRPGRVAIRYRDTDRWGDTQWLTAYLRPADILYFRANGDGTLNLYLRSDRGELAETLRGVRQTLEQLTATLPKQRFLTISRSTVVNLDYVRKLRPRSGETDEFQVVLEGCNDELPVSRARLPQLIRALEL